VNRLDPRPADFLRHCADHEPADVVGGVPPG
jgi:hypothetical protein